MLKIHSVRQEYFIGHLASKYTFRDLERFLTHHGFEKVILAWKDPDEILSMRRIDKEVFQYHIRLFGDYEVRGHYEYSSEGSLLGHIIKRRFEPRGNYFKKFLGDYLS